jgi:hypothetical protein
LRNGFQKLMRRSPGGRGSEAAAASPGEEWDFRAARGQDKMAGANADVWAGGESKNAC